MKSSIYVFDPTASDSQSRVRGVGRYLQLLKENFSKEFRFVSNFKDFKDFIDFKDSIFINPFFNFLQPPLLMKRVAKRQIAVIHDLIPLKYPEHFPAGIRGNINIYLNKLALKNYDLIVTDSEASKKDIVQILKVEESRVKVVYPCLPNIFRSQILDSRSLKKVKKLSKIYDLAPNISYCLYVGDATWNKNLVNLAKAIKIINVPCVFVGKVFAGVGRGRVSDPTSSFGLRGTSSAGGPALRDFKRRRERIFQQDPQLNHPWQKEFKEFIELTKDDKRFIFPGFIDDYKLVKFYQQAKLNVLISRDEGFGFSYLEAASFACPSVLSDIPVLHEISNNEGVVFANPNDPNGIANQLGEIYFHPELKNKLGLEAQQQSKHFSQNKFIKSWKITV